MTTRKHWTPGNYIEIPVGDNKHCYGVVTITERLAVVDYCDTENLNPEEIIALPILFEVTVMKYGIGKNGWPIAGKIELSDRFKTKPYYYKKDMINGKYSIVDHTWMNEVSATKEECQHLEVAAAWDPCHIEERLNEHYGLQ
tara:strand:+ start:438 stop:863 length:426 start_codon:yes stop_codon:yes gene_type:complete